MQSWDIRALEIEPHTPEILSTSAEARAIVLQLPAGERLQEHEVHEHAWVLVIDGSVEIAAGSDASRVSGGPGLLVEFPPQERHEVLAHSDSRLLLVFTPWPGVGHPGAMTLDQKSHVRERAAEHRDRSARPEA